MAHHPPAPSLAKPLRPRCPEILRVEKPLQLENFWFSSLRKAFGVLPLQKNTPSITDTGIPAVPIQRGRGCRDHSWTVGHSWTHGRWPQLSSACFESQGYFSAGISQPYGCHNNNCSSTLQTGSAATQHPRLFPALVRLSSLCCNSFTRESVISKPKNGK